MTYRDGSNTHVMHKAWIVQSKLALTLFANALLLATPTSAQQKNSQLPSVIVQTIEEKDVTPEFRYVGRVVARDTVSIRGRVSGILERRNFVEGHTVKEGLVLFELEKAPYQVVVDQRKAQLASAKAKLVNAEADFKRKSSLQGRNVVSEASLDES